MKIAANISMLYTDLPLLERVAAASAAGFSGVEIQFPYTCPAELLSEALALHDMPLVLINLPAGDLMVGGAGVAAVPYKQEEFDEALQAALTYAAVVRPRAVNVLPGRLADGVSRQAAMGTLVSNLRESATAFAELGIRVMFEAINPLDMPGFLINSAEDMSEILDKVAHPNCFAQIDIYHMARQEYDARQVIQHLSGRIGHVQFADCPGRGAPGSGEVDFAKWRNALRDGGYLGVWGAEYQAAAPTPESLKWLGDWSPL